MARSEGLAVEASVAATPGVLEDREALGSIAVERTRMPMVVVDARRADLPIAMANQAFLNLTGYGAGDVIGRNCRFMQGPETSAAAVQRLRDGLARQETFDVELLNYRKDGSTFWNAVHVSPVRDQDGRLIYYFGSQWDVSERYAAEALRVAQQRLLREVDHRAMNALALVQGFVRLSRKDSVEHFARAVQARVDVLARAHTTLARTRWADVTLEHLLKEELGPATARVAMDGPQVFISATRVQAFALLLHELAANAILHGALAQPEGRLEVAWRPGRGPGVVDLAWREHGTPTAPYGPAGFGRRLIASIVRSQLQGRMGQAWGGEGLTVDLTCRITDTAEAQPAS